jgi:hypothetical protein
MTKKSKLPSLDAMAQLADLVPKYAERVSNPNDPRFRTPEEKANAFAEKHLYRLARRLRRHLDLMEAFKAEAASKAWSPGPELLACSFAWVATVFFGLQGPLEKSHRNQIRLMAHKLQYADEAGIPGRFLTGRIYQIGGSKEIERLRAAKSATRRNDTVVAGTRTKAKRRVKRNMSLAARKKRGRGARIGKRGM